MLGTVLRAYELINYMHTLTVIIMCYIYYKAIILKRVRIKMCGVFL